VALKFYKQMVVRLELLWLLVEAVEVVVQVAPLITLMVAETGEMVEAAEAFGVEAAEVRLDTQEMAAMAHQTVEQLQMALAVEALAEPEQAFGAAVE
jgi:hypothetical protein